MTFFPKDNVQLEVSLRFLAVLLALSFCIPSYAPFDGLWMAAEARRDFEHECAERLSLCAKYNSQQMGKEDDSAKQIRAEVDQRFRTLRIFPKSGRIPPNAKARVLLLHGIGMSYSSAGSWHAVINVVGGAEGSSGKTINFVKNLPVHVPLGVEAVDLMYHRSGPKTFSLEFSWLSAITSWIGEYIFQMKQERPDLPVIVVARSAAARFAAAANNRFPGLMDGLVLISPTVPGGPARDKLQYEGAVQEVGDRIDTLDMETITWFFRTTRSINWKVPGYFGSTPVLCLTGSTDPQVLPDDRVELEGLSKSLPNFEYEDLKGAGHNLFATNGKLKRTGRRAYERFYNFVSGRVLPRFNSQPATSLPRHLRSWFDRTFGWQ
ncbi:MAG: hypothetical protein HY537_17840 [Deltaproteobacteria bacterium]|nr:hypothetical protein [Deltaproteobacteria bacterium]